MKTVYCDTADAVFQFQAKDVIEHLKDSLNDFDDEGTAKLLKIICTDCRESIEIRVEHELFRCIALSLLEKGKGVVTCKACNKSYDAGQLKSAPSLGLQPPNSLDRLCEL